MRDRLTEIEARDESPFAYRSVIAEESPNTKREIVSTTTLSQCGFSREEVCPGKNDSSYDRALE